MEFASAMKARVTFAEAKREIEAHGHQAEYRKGGFLWACAAGEEEWHEIAHANIHGEFSGGRILRWLGY
jgi:hypothetical protein